MLSSNRRTPGARSRGKISDHDSRTRSLLASGWVTPHPNPFPGGRGARSEPDFRLPSPFGRGAGGEGEPFGGQYPRRGDGRDSRSLIWSRRTPRCRSAHAERGPETHRRVSALGIAGRARYKSSCCLPLQDPAKPWAHHEPINAADGNGPSSAEPTPRGSIMEGVSARHLDDVVLLRRLT